MESDFGMRRWVMVALVLIAAVAIGSIAYQAGVERGIASHPPAAAAPGTTPDGQAAAPAPYPYYPYRYYGPWRFGFVGPLISLFVFFFILRALMFALFGWGWGWRRRWWRYGPDFDPRYGPYAFEEWHRRAHEQMRDDRAPAPPTA